MHFREHLLAWPPLQIAAVTKYQLVLILGGENRLEKCR